MLDISKMTVTIDGVVYIGETLSPQAQETLRHVIDLREKKQRLQFEMTQLDVADHAFSEALRNLAPKQEEAVNG